jgi:hypothetical protein
VLKIKRLEGFVVQAEPTALPTKCSCLQSPAKICRALERVVHMSAADAAQALGLSARGFKQQLRAVGIDYWPGRAARGLFKE